MRANPRGPYARLRWYCNDGTVHPPQPYPCAERGGGMQHGEYSPERARLADLGWHVGTIFAATDFDELWDARNRQSRLREIPLERHAYAAADGWVLEKARTYRGRVQVEDEEAKGREILLRLLRERDWVADNYLVAREVVRAIPHVGAGGDRTREVRDLAKRLAQQDRSFEELRVRIHNEPSAADIPAVNRWIEAARARGASASAIALAEKSVAEMEALYGRSGRTERMRSAQARLAAIPEVGGAAELLADVAAAPARDRVRRLAAVLVAPRPAVEKGALAPESALELVDLSVDAEVELLAAAQDVQSDRTLSRSDLLGVGLDLVDGAYGAGFLSGRERDEIHATVRPMRDAGGQASTSDYLTAARALERASTWALGTVRHAFAEPLVRYAALEPASARFPDDLLRSSAMLPLAQVAGRLARDAERQNGLLHRVLGQEVDGAAGLNPGVAIGTLRVARDAAETARLEPDAIAVLSETVSELPPVAGIVTLSAGNALSHVQMLARNLGIPNAVLPALALESIARREGERVLFAVGTGGSVVLVPVADVDAALAAEVTGTAADDMPRVDAPVPDLTMEDLIPLAQLEASLSGRLVGPKAANVGELAKLFPGRVAAAVALPFGIYARHAARGAGSPKARLDAAFERRRAGEIDAAALAAEVEAVRVAVESLRIDDELRAALAPHVRSMRGGMFVRSDTNVEDLPQFTGAGLNKTVPNVVGLDAVLAAIPKVWASPFSQRAMAWRSRALTRPEEVYPSVLLMESVPSSKSGVLVTRDVVTGGKGLTLTVAHGVGGGVDGETSETLVLRPDGGVVLVSEAKAPYQRRLVPEGGVAWAPAPSGSVLDPGEIAQVRTFASELDAKMAPALDDDGQPLPWDVELGFVDGDLVLFQVRPLVERGALRADRVVRSLAPASGSKAPTTDLSRPPAALAAARTQEGPVRRAARQEIP